MLPSSVMSARIDVCALSLLFVLGCGSGSDSNGGSGCPDIDIGSPSFSPPQAKDGESVTVTFDLESGTPSNSCPTPLWLDCGGQETRYMVGYASGVPQANVILHCDQATAPVECSYSYEYPESKPNQFGAGSGPTCEP
jgi:hypothetical protein